MTVDDARLNELRRIAFGRTQSPEDEARAAAARLELEAALTVPDDTTAPLPDAPPVAQPVEAHTEEPVEPQRARRPTWLLPTAIALAVGVLLGAGSMIATGRGIAAPVAAPTPEFTPGSSDLPPTVDPLRAKLALEPGSIAGADAWLDGEQDPEDEFSGNAYLYDFYQLDPASTRLAVSSQRGQIWVGTTTDGKYCLFAVTSTQSGGDCVTPEVLQQSGISLLGDSTLLVAWNGDRISMSTTKR